MLDQAKAWVKAQYWSRRDYRAASAGTADAGLPVILNSSGYLATTLLTPSDPWTPGLTFGGGSTGITYSVQVGRYSRIGNIVIATGFLALTSKGALPSQVRITGLPIASKNLSNFNQVVTVRLDGMTGISGSIMGFIGPNLTTVRVEHLGTGTAAELQDTHFTNTSSVMVTAIYEV